MASAPTDRPGTVKAQIVALIAGTTGAGSLFAAAAEASDPMGIAPYVGGGAGVIAVGALGEVTRRLLNGRLVPRETADHEAEMSAALLAAGQREAMVIQHAERTLRVAEDSAGMVVETAKALREHTERTASDLAAVTAKQTESVTLALVQVTRAVDDLRDELRDLRRGGRP